MLVLNLFFPEHRIPNVLDPGPMPHSHEYRVLIAMSLALGHTSQALAL